MFFRRAGQGAVAMKKFSFWKNFKFACSDQSVQDGNSEELLGIKEWEYNKWVTGINDGNAMRTKNWGNRR